MAQLVSNELEVFGQLESLPHITENANGKQATAIFMDSQAVERAIESLNGLVFTIELSHSRNIEANFRKRCAYCPNCESWGHSVSECPKKDSARDQSRMDRPRDQSKTVFVGNVAYGASEEELQEVFSRCGEVVSIRITRDKQTGQPKGYAFVDYVSKECALHAVQDIHAAEFQGRPLKVSLAGEKASGIVTSDSKEQTTADNASKVSPVSKNSRRGGKKTAKQTQDTVRIHLDELAMPKRPQVPPTTSDCEVWVDPLPDKHDLAELCGVFGDYKEVFRVREGKTNRPGDRGYIKFKSHEAALQCVSSGVGKWSESERALSSAKRSSRVGAYPVSLVSLILGPQGSKIREIQDELGPGTTFLGLRGVGETDVYFKATSSRVHFVCKALPEVILDLQHILEKHLELIHEEMTARIQAHTDRGAGSRSLPSRPRRKRSHSRGHKRGRDDLNPQPSPGAPWYPPPVHPPPGYPPPAYFPHGYAPSYYPPPRYHPPPGYLPPSIGYGTPSGYHPAVPDFRRHYTPKAVPSQSPDLIHSEMTSSRRGAYTQTSTPTGKEHWV